MEMKINVLIPNVDKIECLIFDLGGVILDIDFELTVQAFQKLGIETKDARDIFAKSQSLFLNLELGLISPTDFIALLHNTYPSVSHIKEDKIWEAWNALLMPFKEERVILLKELAKKYKVYLLSNTNLPHRIKFREMYKEQFSGNFDDLFIKCFYSDEMNLRKPQLEIYEQVEKEIGIKGYNILFIDDLQINIEAAKSCGWNAYNLEKGEDIIDLF